MKKIIQFYGGIHPPTLKINTADKPIKKVFIPKRVVIPLLQHVGSPAEPVVKVGDEVSVGKVIGKPAGFISSAVHATISGKVAKIDYSHTRARDRVLSVTIEAQGDENQDFKTQAVKGAENLSGQELINIIRDAGIVGLGGAVFPTHVKLSPPKDKPIDYVILNGAECEPYLTCDHRLMIEKPGEILKGLDIIVKAVGAKEAYIAIEDNKRAAIYATEKALLGSRDKGQEARVKVAVLKTKYPQGAEKQLVKSILNKTVPADGLPMDIGCLVQNVGTAFAIYEAVYLGKPLIERVVTITGSCVREPLNLRVRIGTLLTDLVNSFGGFVKEPKKVIIGGPMMGIAQYTMEVPITKGANGVIFLSAGEADEPDESVCIRCGKCVEVCPMGLAPTSIMYYVKNEKFLEAKALGVWHCFECGACAYECPAKIPLLDYIKFGKSKT